MKKKDWKQNKKTELGSDVSQVTIRQTRLTVIFLEVGIKQLVIVFGNNAYQRNNQHQRCAGNSIGQRPMMMVSYCKPAPTVRKQKTNKGLYQKNRLKQIICTL